MILICGVFFSATLGGLTPSVSSLAGVPLEMTQEEVTAVLKTKVRGASPEQIERLSARIYTLCGSHHFSPAYVLSLIQAESRFKIDARSHRGAIGLMQLMPSTAAYIAERSEIDSYRKANDLRDPVINVTVGIHYLSYLRERFGKSNLTLAAYNLGPNKLRRLESKRALKIPGVKRYVSAIHNGVATMRQEGQKLAAPQGPEVIGSIEHLAISAALL